MPEQNKEWEEMMKRIDFAGVMKAFEKGDKEWHAQEWKRFIKEIRHSLLKEILENVGGEEYSQNNIIGAEVKAYLLGKNAERARTRGIIEGYLKGE